MRTTTKAAIASIALIAAGAAPALADHTEEHGTTPSCYGQPPAEDAEGDRVSGFTVFAGEGGHVGYRTRDIYGIASVSGDGVKVGVFQPSYDPAAADGNNYVDVGAEVRTNGSYRTCNGSTMGQP